MQVRFYFLHNYNITTTGSLHSNFFSFKLQQIISFSCLANDIRHVQSIKDSISLIDDRVLIEHCSFDVVLSFTVKKILRTVNAKQLGENYCSSQDSLCYLCPHFHSIINSLSKREPISPQEFTQLL